mgnify:CR=1 FL=1
MSKKCTNPQCNREIQDSAVFCPFCGTQQVDDSNLTEEERLRKQLAEQQDTIRVLTEALAKQKESPMKDDFLQNAGEEMMLKDVDEEDFDYEFDEEDDVDEFEDDDDEFEDDNDEFEDDENEDNEEEKEDANDSDYHVNTNNASSSSFSGGKCGCFVFILIIVLIIEMLGGC